MPAASSFLITVCVNETVFQDEEPCNRHGRIITIADKKSTRTFNSISNVYSSATTTAQNATAASPLEYSSSPLVIRGKEKTKNRPAGGTRRYADCKRQLWDRYELSTIKKTDVGYLLTKTKINICVYCKNMKGRGKQKCRRAFAFVYDGVGQHRARWFYETYRKRFGIESSYRQSHACRIRTSTRSALLRLLYFALSMFLRNLGITFEREEIFAGGIGKQQTSGYYGFENFRSDMQKNIAKMIPIWTRKNKT